jgi:two-component system sensor histidine kinase ChvG
MQALFSILNKPRIRTVLLSVNIAVLLLPLAGIWGFRLYETELIRRTEAELIAQTVLLKEIYLHEYARLNSESEGVSTLLGPHIDLKFRDINRIRAGEFRKIYPRLDINRERKREPIITEEISKPLTNPAALAIGSEMDKIIQKSQFSLLSGIRIVSADGSVIASTGHAIGHQITDREEVRRALRGEQLSIIRTRAYRDMPTHSLLSYGTGVIVFVAHPVVIEDRILGAVIASRTPTNLANAIYEHRYHLIRFAGLLIALVLLATILTAATIGGPIRRLAAMTTKDARNRPGKIKPLKRPGTAEVAALSEAFATMSNSMHERADYTEGLVRSISHEFKTPIASINASVEILEDHLDTMTTEERKKFLSMISKDSHRLQRLVERLLELARADAIMNPAGNCSPLLVIEKVKTEFSAASQHIELNLEKNLDSLTIAMPSDSFESCMLNIVQNSINHGGPNTLISVRAFRANSSMFGVTIIDDGIGIDPRDRSKVFDAFFTTARTSGGTGLGLSIVKSLLNAYGGTVELDTPLKGTSISMYIPFS